MQKEINKIINSVHKYITETLEQVDCTDIDISIHFKNETWEIEVSAINFEGVFDERVYNCDKIEDMLEYIKTEI